MVNRKKRLKQGIESLEHQLDLHEDKLKRAEDDDNWELADYYYPPRILRGLTKEDPQLNWLEKPIGFSQTNN